MAKSNEIVNWLKLCNIKGLGPKKILSLLDIFTDIDTLFNTPSTDLVKSRIFKESMVEEWIKLRDGDATEFETIVDTCRREGIKITPIYAKIYPLQLKLMLYPPLTLYTKGEINLLDTKKIAVVGSRKSDDKSKEWTFKIAKELSKKNITIVSGGAKGIDYEAHKGALSVSGKTICVLGSGLLKMYPSEHKELFETINEKGLLISEHPPEFVGGRISLLQRNRITSGISECLLAVTSASDGGTMTQLKIAFDQRIPVFAPKLSLDLTPNEGIKETLNQLTQIENINPIIAELNKPKPVYLQNKLL